LRAEGDGVDDVGGRIDQLEHFAGLVQSEAQVEAGGIREVVRVEQQVGSAIQDRIGRELEFERNTRFVAETPAGEIDWSVTGVVQLD